MTTFVSENKAIKMILNFIKHHWDGALGGGFGMVLAFLKTPVVELIINTVIVTMSAYVAKEIAKLIHEKIKNKWK